MSQPLLNHLNPVTGDMESTLALYRLLGIDIPDSKVRRTETGVHHVDLALPNGFGLDFDSPALAQVSNASWGAHHAIVEDPNGNRVARMSPIDPARCSAGPELRLIV